MHIPYGEGIYKEKYLKNSDKKFVDGIWYAIQELENCEPQPETGLPTLDNHLGEVTEMVLKEVKNGLICTAREVVVAAIDSYSEDYLNACYELEAKENGNELQTD